MSTGPWQPERPKPAAPLAAGERPFLLRAALYPDCYTWYVLLSAIDVAFTVAVLAAGGSELNAIADWIIVQYNVPGMAVFKFLSVTLVIVVCELIGRRNAHKGRKLACWAVALSAFPVLVGGLHLVTILVQLHTGDR